jgi:hypothetical protein
MFIEQACQQLHGQPNHTIDYFSIAKDWASKKNMSAETIHIESKEHFIKRIAY